MRNTDANKFAQYATDEITGAIRAEGRKQAEVATVLDRSQSYVSDRFTGRTFFDLGEIESIGAWLGYDGGQFIVDVVARAEQRLNREQRATVTELHPRYVQDERAAAYDDEPEPGDVDDE
jgi:hypothetical protein